MVSESKEKQCYYPNCGYHPDLNPSCNRVRKAYGGCSGPCSGPCYVMTDMKQTPQKSSET